MNYHPAELWGGAAAIGLLTAAWSKARLLLSRITSLAIVSVTIDGEAARAVQALCWRDFYRSPFGARRYSSGLEYVRPSGRSEYIAWERIGDDPLVFWRGWRPLILGLSAQKNGADGGLDTARSSDQMRVTFIRGTWDADSLIEMSVKRLNSLHHVGDQCKNTGRRFFIKHCIGIGAPRRGSGGDGSDKSGVPTSVPSAGIYLGWGNVRLLGWDSDDIGPPIIKGQSAIDDLALETSTETAVEEVRRWRESKEWYQKRRIPWTRGLLLHGKPGTGKTALVRAIAQDLDLPVFVFDLASLSNSEMTSMWRSMQADAPCVALLEDLDAVFSGRTNRIGKSGGGLSFDCLLNCLGGIEAAEGVFKVVTTNNVAELDEALGVPRAGTYGSTSTRPGRLDRAIEMPILNEAGRRKLASRILSDCPRHIERIIREGQGDSGAQFTERCASLALSELWKCSPLQIAEGIESAA